MPLTLTLTDDSVPRHRRTWDAVAVSEDEEHTIRTLLANLVSTDELIAGLRALDAPRPDGVFWEIADLAEGMDIPVLELETP